MKVHTVTFILLVVGGLNWLLVGLLGWDVSEFFGGQASAVARLLYVLVGASAVYEVVMHKKHCRECEVKEGAAQSVAA